MKIPLSVNLFSLWTLGTGHGLGDGVYWTSRGFSVWLNLTHSHTLDAYPLTANSLPSSFCSYLEALNDWLGWKLKYFNSPLLLFHTRTIRIRGTTLKGLSDSTIVLCLPTMCHNLKPLDSVDSFLCHLFCTHSNLSNQWWSFSCSSKYVSCLNFSTKRPKFERSIESVSPYVDLARKHLQ